MALSSWLGYRGRPPLQLSAPAEARGVCLDSCSAAAAAAAEQLVVALNSTQDLLLHNMHALGC